MIELSARGCGKTTRMIEWLRSGPNRLMLVISEQERRRIISEKDNLDLANKIVTFEMYRRQIRRASQGIQEIGIDNADIILEDLIGRPISKMTMTDDEL